MNTVWVRPDPANGYQDFLIPEDIAKRLFAQGKLARDLTNGGYTGNGKDPLPYNHKVVPR